MSGATGRRGGLLEVGITLYVRRGQQSIWENGIFQNCFLLATLLLCAPRVGSVRLVNGGDGDPTQSGDFLAASPVPVIDLATALDELDVVIELSAQLDPTWAQAFREKGGRIVAMHVANDYVIDIERMIYGLAPGMRASGVVYDSVWTLPSFEATCASYYRHVLGAPVRTMGHLWSPAMLEHRAAESGVAFEYVPGRTRWRLAVCEPNICSVKTCHIPMLVCDVAHRQAPDVIVHLRVHNTLQMKANPDFVAFARSLDLVNHGIATFEPRLPIADILGVSADALVSHHWENAQNYLYYEALWGGFPLIHNSALLGGCGYRYRDFDCEDGARALRRAHAMHDASLAGYRRDARAFLDTLHPANPDNVRQYEAALEALFA
ncbi:hypothetical protein BEN78_09660 [Xanthomonas citri pv. mangiferaeindicae]|nr:hypothetical protein BEN78_09660 [Xanthomonas citri pv. mangiferaeindicae]